MCVCVCVCVSPHKEYHGKASENQKEDNMKNQPKEIKVPLLLKKHQ